MTPRGRAGVQRRARSGRRHLAVVVLARAFDRRRLHLPHLPQRPRPRRRAGALGLGAPALQPRRGALPQRPIRPRHPPDLRRASSPGSAASSSPSIPISATSPTSAAYLDRMARSGKAEFLVVAGNRGEAEEIIRQARRRGLTMPVLGGDGLEGIHEAGALAEGVYLSSAYFPNLPTAGQPPLRRGLPAEVPRRGHSQSAGRGHLRCRVPAARRHRARGHRAPGRAPRARRGRVGDARRSRASPAPSPSTPPATCPTRTSTSAWCRNGDVTVSEDATETVAQAE